MPGLSIKFGIFLILVGLIGYGYSSFASPTALIPAGFGILMSLLGFIALKNEGLRKHLMHGALLVAILGFLGTFSGLLKLPAFFSGTAERPVAVVSQAVTAIICMLFVALGVRSFMAARKGD